MTLYETKRCLKQAAANFFLLFSWHVSTCLPGHLAVRTFGGQGLKGAKWAVGCGQMAVGTFDGQEICYKGPNGCWDILQLGELLEMAKWAVGTLDKWLLAHFAVRVIARKGQMAVGKRDKWLLGHWTNGCWHILQSGILIERAKWLLEHGTYGCWDIW